MCYTVCMNDKKKNATYQYDRTCVYNIHYHVVWCVKYRNRVLTPAIADDLKAILNDIALEKGFTIEACEIGDGDHIHVFVTAKPKLSITSIVTWMKGISARRLFLAHPELKNQLWGGHLWNGSYFVETIGSTSEENIRRYIENQKSL